MKVEYYTILPNGFSMEIFQRVKPLLIPYVIELLSLYGDSPNKPLYLVNRPEGLVVCPKEKLDKESIEVSLDELIAIQLLIGVNE